MTVTQIQMDIVWGDIQANCLQASHLIDSTPGSDLYVLPEMFSTGFAVHPEGIADTQGLTLEWMKEKARQTDAAICGSVAIRDERGRYFNRFYFVTPDGRVQKYDKRHLFSYGGEHLRYQSGKRRVVVSWRGCRFLLQVCYDVRFPVFSRNASSGRQHYDCALYVASWPESRQSVWEALLVARAIENQCYVLGTNRVGSDAACHYQGGTASYDAYGRCLMSCHPNQEGIITTTLDLDKLHHFRQKFPVLSDADAFSLA